MLVEAALCLSLNVYHEARSETWRGQVAVAQVHMRRAGFKMDKVCAELVKPEQFSWTTEQTLTLLKSPAFRKALGVSEYTITWALHGVGEDYANGADHYHSVAVLPYWTKCATRTVKIDRHIFYKDVKPCKGKK